MDLGFYRYSSKLWDNIYEKGYIAFYPNEHVKKFVFNNFSQITNKNNVKILDLGCGAGNNLWMLAREGYDVYGFDGSRKALERAKKKLDKENLKAKLKQGDFLNLPYEDNFFEAVIDDASIESNNIRDIELIFKQVYRVLKERGGKYHGMFISSDSKSSMIGREIEKNTFAETGGVFINRKRIIHFFDESELRTILNDSGFSDIEINYVIATKNNSKDFIKFWLVDATK